MLDDILEDRCWCYLSQGKPAVQQHMLGLGAAEIVARFAAAYRAFVVYYRLADNLIEARRLERVMTESLVRTLAEALHIQSDEIRKRYGTKITTPDGERFGLRVVALRPNLQPYQVATWGEIPLSEPPQPSPEVLLQSLGAGVGSSGFQ